MAFVIALLLVAIVSFILTLRSMGNFEVEPQPKKKYGLFLIRNNLAFNLELFSGLSKFASKHNYLISVERLMKGDQSVLVLYCPIELQTLYPSLQLLELEDFVQDPNIRYNPANPSKIAVLDYSLGWELSKDKKLPDFNRSVFNSIDLKENQLLFWQAVLQPVSNSIQRPGENKFQTTMRILVIDQNHQQRIELAKMVNQYIKDVTGLKNKQTNQTTKSVYESYKKRTFKPSKAKGLVLSDNQLLNLLRV